MSYSSQRLFIEAPDFGNAVQAGFLLVTTSYDMSNDDSSFWMFKIIDENTVQAIQRANPALTVTYYNCIWTVTFQP